MDPKLPAALAKRLAAYSAAAGAALACAPASAQVVYHDIEPDAQVLPGSPSSSYVLDFDDDGSADLVFHATSSYPRYYTYYVSFRRPTGGPAANGVLGYDAPDFPDPLFGGASRLSSGDVVGPAGAGQGFYPLGIVARYVAGGGPDYAFHNEKGYAGFRFVAGDGQLHYGWIRLTAFGTPSVTGRAFEYAYEATPDTPILAGAVSDAVLDGAVNQTTFPPEGGTLVYTFTLHNTTDDPLPLDLWADVDRFGVPYTTRRLGSGTLPAGATVTLSVTLPVPAGAPFGDYVAVFKLGDFAAQQALTFERYEIRKDPFAPERGGSVSVEGGEAFATSPVPGDLFAEAETAVAGTHVLSASQPNPTSGRTEFTLQAAKAQHVTVAAYDALGRQVAVLHEGTLAAGEAHRLVFDGADLPAGVYVVRAVGETFADTRVLTLTR